MFGFGDSQQSYEQVYDTNENQPRNEGSFGHEALAGAASFAAMRMWENRQRAEGKPVSHAFAKEALMAIVGAEADKLAETKGMDFVDREKVKHQAKENARGMYDEHYGGNDEFNPEQQRPHDSFQQYGGY